MNIDVLEDSKYLMLVNGQDIGAELSEEDVLEIVKIMKSHKRLDSQSLFDQLTSTKGIEGVGIVLSADDTINIVQKITEIKSEKEEEFISLINSLGDIVDKIVKKLTEHGSNTY